MTPHVRPYVAADAPFVRHAWIRGAATLADKLGLSEASAKRRAERICATASIIVAYDVDEPIVSLGFIAHTGRVVHWVYVPRAFCGLGIARALVRRVVGAAPWSTTSKCEGWDARSKRWGCTYAAPARTAGGLNA